MQCYKMSSNLAISQWKMHYFATIISHKCSQTCYQYIQVCKVVITLRIIQNWPENIVLVILIKSVSGTSKSENRNRSKSVKNSHGTGNVQWRFTC